MQSEQYSPPDKLRCGSGYVILNKSAMVDRPYPANSRLWKDIDAAVAKLTPDQFQPHDVYGLATWIVVVLPYCQIIPVYVTYDQQYSEPFAHAYCPFFGA